MSLSTQLAYFAAIYFGAKYYNYNIDAFLLQRGYDIVFIMSHIQIIIQNSSFYKNIKTRINSIFKTKNDFIICIKNNSVEKTISTAPEEIVDGYDMFIFKHENESDERNDLVVFYSIPENQQHDVSIKRCNYTFIQVILKLSYNDSDIEYKINLRDNVNNYYIVNNRLNSIFFGYFLKKEFGVDYDIKNMSYKLSIMDHEVQQIALTENNEIILLENEYTVIDIKKNDISNKTEN